MGRAKLGEVPVGSTVKIAVGGKDYDWLVVHQGLPGSMYDTSCDGTWLLMKDAYKGLVFGTSSSYADSTVDIFLRRTFFNMIDADIQSVIKNVKIPYTNGDGNSGIAVGGAYGYTTKVFLLSGTEVNISPQYMNVEGSKLAYFSSNARRIAYSGGSAVAWWLRSPRNGVNSTIHVITKSGGSDTYGYSWSAYVRPCIILPADLAVDADGKVIVNTAPEINTESTVLGEQSAPFACGYTVSDADGDSLTVTEMLDGKTTATHTGITSGTTLTFEQASTEENFRRILNGSHTIQITADDGVDRTDAKVTFTKNVISASITLETPLAVEGDITVAVLHVGGDIPDDAAFKVEATNNANDSSPVWQDVSDEVKKGTNFVFKNKTAANGAAFNFRVSVARGASGTGGYIEAVSGAFQ